MQLKGGRIYSESGFNSVVHRDEEYIGASEIGYGCRILKVLAHCLLKTRMQISSLSGVVQRTARHFAQQVFTE